jgi:hypothetical protein
VEEVKKLAYKFGRMSQAMADVLREYWREHDQRLQAACSCDICAKAKKTANRRTKAIDGRDCQKLGLVLMPRM